MPIRIDMPKIREQKKKKFVKCNACSNNFLHRESLIRHIQDKHPEEICDENPFVAYKCSSCNRTFQYNRDFVQHLKSEHGCTTVSNENEEEKFVCVACSQYFNKRFELTRHFLKHHQDSDKQFKCNLCGFRYRYSFNLNCHIRRKHPEEWTTGKNKSVKLICALCNRQYSSRKALVSHLRKQHPSSTSFSSNDNRIPRRVNVRKSATRLCPLCSNSFVTKSDILDHFRQKHDTVIELKEMSILNEKSFDDWKTQFENDTDSKFVKYNCYKSKRMLVKWFVCHRSGHFISHSRGVRRMRLLGSGKINGYCPAELKFILRFDDLRCKLEYVDEHVGHDRNLKYLKTSRDHIPSERFLDDITRLCEIPRKERLLSDSIVFTKWMNENQSCVLYYKSPIVNDQEFVRLKSGIDGDFVFILMNRFQSEIFASCANNYVTISSTSGPVGYDFCLTVVMVLDEQMEGIPCAFMLTNRCDRYVYEILFTKIRNRSGAIRPKVFMSDERILIDAWNRTMPKPNFQLLCSWRVHLDWKKNLSKIESIRFRNTTFRRLFEMRTELNPFRFSERFSAFIADKDARLSDFKLYFRQYYENNVTSWAYCHRKYAGLNTNAITRGFFRKFRRLYLRRKSLFAFEDLLYGCTECMKNLCSDIERRSLKGKLGSKLRQIRITHSTSLIAYGKKLDQLQQIDENLWYVPDFEIGGDEIRTVERTLIDCDCKLCCPECDSCVHQYRCSCTDNCVRFNMCVHIHAVISSNRRPRVLAL